MDKFANGNSWIYCSAHRSSTIAAHVTGCFIKVDMCGDKHMSVLQNFLRQRPAGGERVPRKDGNRCGHCCLKQWHRVLNCYAAGARKRVEDSANVSELLWNAHRCAGAVASAITTTLTKRNCFKITCTEQFHLNCVQRAQCTSRYDIARVGAGMLK